MSEADETPKGTDTAGRLDGLVGRFERDFARYLVCKRRDAIAALTEEELAAFAILLGKVDRHRSNSGKRPLTCVVVEDDWPEYEPTWKAIEARMTPNK